MSWKDMICNLAMLAAIVIIVVHCSGCATNRCDVGGVPHYTQGALTLCQYK
jgi:hypothetical protein